MDDLLADWRDERRRGMAGLGSEGAVVMRRRFERMVWKDVRIESKF